MVVKLLLYLGRACCATFIIHGVVCTACLRHEWNFLSTGIIYQSGESGLSITHGLTKQVGMHVSNVSMSDVF